MAGSYASPPLDPAIVELDCGSVVQFCIDNVGGAGVSSIAPTIGAGRTYNQIDKPIVVNVTSRGNRISASGSLALAMDYETTVASNNIGELNFGIICFSKNHIRATLIIISVSWIYVI